MAFLAGLGGLTGFLSNSPSNRTTTTSGTGTSSTSGTSSSTQNLNPFQSTLQGPLFNYITQLMTPGGAQAAVAPFTQASRDATSSTYAGLADHLRQQFLATGNGQSGKFGNALVQGNLQRLGDLQKVDTTGQQMAASLPLEASSLATNLLEHPFGSTTSSSTSGTTAGNSTQVGPGSQAAGLLQGLTAGVSSGQSQLASILAAMNNSGGN